MIVLVIFLQSNTKCSSSFSNGQCFGGTHLTGVENQLNQLRHQSVGQHERLQVRVHQWRQENRQQVTQHRGFRHLLESPQSNHRTTRTKWRKRAQMWSRFEHTWDMNTHLASRSLTVLLIRAFVTCWRVSSTSSHPTRTLDARERILACSSWHNTHIQHTIEFCICIILVTAKAKSESFRVEDADVFVW